MPLCRTESYICLSTATSPSLSVVSANGSCRPSVPYQQSLQFYAQQRHRQKPAGQNMEPITIKTRLERKFSQPAPASSRSLTRTPSLFDVTVSDAESNPPPFRIPAFCRASSPLSPQRRLLSGRPVFPKSIPDPDLYRLALMRCLQYSFQGRKFSQMGPQPAPSVLAATQDLERIVAEENTIASEDYPMKWSEDYPMDCEDDFSQSWMNLQYEDWEMSDGEDTDN